MYLVVSRGPSRLVSGVEETYVLARHSVDGYVLVRGVRGVVRGVRGRQQRGVGRQPGRRVRRVVVVVQLRVVVEGRHAVHAAAAAVHAGAVTAGACTAYSSSVHTAYGHCSLKLKMSG